MKIGDKVIVSGKAYSGICYLENTAFIDNFISETKYNVIVKFLDGTIDAVQQEAVRLWDYR